MISFVFSILDTKVGAFSNPFCVRHPAEAYRACSALAGDLNTHVGRHPADFVLMELGTFDDNRGTFECAVPSSHGPMTNFIERRPSPPDFFSAAMPTGPQGPGPVTNGHAVAAHEVP